MSFFAGAYVMHAMKLLKFVLPLAVAVAIARAKGEVRTIFKEKAP
ncbi:MAG: hypothetical protein ABSE59_08600 [Opitutaceae bacterium]|jgi:hypothetical protein